MQKTLEKIEVKRFDNPDETRTFPKGRLDLIHVGGMTIGRATFEPGWRWSTCVKPLVNTKSCEQAHVGYLVSGSLRTRMDDGSEMLGRPGDAVNIPPGHDGWVEGTETVVFIDFQGMKDYAKR